MLRVPCVLALLPELGAVAPKQKRRRTENSRNAAHDCQRPVYANARVHWAGGHDHASRGQVPDGGNACKSDGRMLPVAVYDVLVAAHIECGQDSAKDKTSAETAPDGYARVIGPAEPEETDR